MADTMVWTLGSYDFLANNIEPYTVSLNRGWRLNPVILPLGQGVLVNTTPKRNAIPLNISGRISGTSSANLRSKLDTLTAILDDGRQQLNIFDDRYINVTPQTWQIEFIRGSGLQLADFTIDLLADEGVWISETLDSSDYTTNTTPTVSNGGNTSTPIKLTITAPSGGLTQFISTNSTTNKILTWDGNLLVGDILIIDMGTMEITEAGLSTLDGFSGVFWEINSGNNTLSFTSTPTGTAFTLEKRDRWS